MNRLLNKIAICICAVLFMCSFCSISAHAQSPASVATAPFYTHQGETFTTTLHIPDNANIVDFDVTLKYNPELITLVSVEESEDIKGTIIYNDSEKGKISINYTRTNKNVTSYLPLLDITFKVDDNVGVGSYECLTVDQNETCIAHRLNNAGTLDKVDMVCDLAKLVMYEMGDVDLSESVDIGDATYIRRHLAEFEGATLNEYKLSLADTFSDGVIDIADAVTLQRHLARLEGLYGNRVNVIFYDKDGQKYATKSVVYDGNLVTMPAIPFVEGYAGGKWSSNPTEYVAPMLKNLKQDIKLYVVYSDHADPVMDFYKTQLTKIVYGGDLPTNMNSDPSLVSRVNYQGGQYATIVWNSDCNYVINSMTGKFTKPTYPQDVTLIAHIISYDANDIIQGEDSIIFKYAVPGEYITPTKEEVAGFLDHYLADSADGKYRINYDVKLLNKVNNTTVPTEGAAYDNFEIRLDWYYDKDGTLTPISTVKRTTEQQVMDFVAVASFNGKPLEDDGKIYFDHVEVTAIDQMEIKNYIILQIAAKQGTLATNNTALWNEDFVYGTTVTWESGNANIAYVENNVIKLKDNAVSGTILPLNARVSYQAGGKVKEFVLSYNLTVSCNNTIIKAPENMDPELYKAIKEELADTLGFRGDLTSAALGDVKFVNLDLSAYPEITSLRGLSYCKNLRTLNISGLHITDGTMNQISTLSSLEAFVARDCGLNNLSDGGAAVLKNATNLRLLDLTNNNFTTLDSVFGEGVRYGLLREAYLANNKLTDINALSRAPILTYLSLANNGLTTEGTACLANFPCLQYLSLADNKIDSVKNIADLKYLVELRLQNNQISNVDGLRKMIYLEALYLGHNQIKEVGFLNTLGKLEVLYINDNQVSDISALRDLNSLKAINVNNNKISSLSVLMNYRSTLTEIYAENNNVTDFSFINGASKLHILMLAGNKLGIAQDNMTTWLAGLGDLEILTLSDIRLNDLSFLDAMEKLARFEVANCGFRAMSGEVSNVGMIAGRYDTLKILDISNNDLTDAPAEIQKLRNVTHLAVLYADNICNDLDAYTLTLSMTELMYISMENCGITSIDWLSKLNNLVYVDLAGNNISSVSFDENISKASAKTLDELYLDTNVPCSFGNSFYLTDFNVRKLSLAGVTISKMEYMPNLPKIKYLNLENTGLSNLTGDIAEMAEVYSLARYSDPKDLGTYVETIDLSRAVTDDISIIEGMTSVKTLYAVDEPTGQLFYQNNLRSLQRLYNKGVNIFLYDKNTKYAPDANKEGAAILNLLDDISCDVIVAADKVISDNNPALTRTINGFDISWSVSNATNYEIQDYKLAVRDYTAIENETLTLTAAITVYPDQAPATRSFTINTSILRVSEKYYETDATGYSEQLTRDAAFKYMLSLKAAETEGFSVPVKPVEDQILYAYSAVTGEGQSIPSPNVLTVVSDGSYQIGSAAPLGATATITINIGHINKAAEFVSDTEALVIPVTVASRTFTAQFVLNGGTLTDANGIKRESVEYVEDSPIFANLTFSRTGYSFGGWYTDAGFTTLFSADGTDAVMPSNSITLYAKWNPLSYTIHFNAGEGSVGTTSMTALSDVAVGELPVATRTNYTFDGWFTAASGGTQVTASSVFARTTDLTLYAHYTINTYNLLFNANGGTVGETTKMVTIGTAVGTLPTPSRDYYNFNGWYTAVTGGTQVTNTTVLGATTDTTLYAQWSLKPESSYVMASAVPAGAQVVNRKWTYTLTTLTESTSETLAGYTAYDSYWVKDGTSSYNYSREFPSGFDTTHSLYSWNRDAATAYTNNTNKREVSNAWAGYIYYHWAINASYYNTMERAVAPKKLTWNNWVYKYFYAFTSTVNCASAGTGYSCDTGTLSYNCSSIIPDKSSLGTYCPRFFRFNYYTTTYTDYHKVFKYKKVQDNLESATNVSGQSGVSNVVEWVTYREK